jgi:hypothetical protein
MDMGIQHEFKLGHAGCHVHAAWHGQVDAACQNSSPCWMSMSILHVHVHDACPSTCCMSLPMLHAHVCYMFMFMSMLHVHVNVACSSPCSRQGCISMSMLHVHVPAAWT